MKTKLFYLFIFAALSSFTLDKTYVWDKYKLQITVPDDFKVTKNTNEDFEMSGEGMELAMSIFEGDITLEQMDEATLEGAKSMKLTEVDAAHAVKSNGLEGFYVEGFLEGERVMFAGMIDPKSHTNFFIAITFGDDDKTAEEDALKILNSIKRIR
ncbi:MAG: hypothetical protein ACK4NY_19385 [Spirosomataceae bacterium]